MNEIRATQSHSSSLSDQSSHSRFETASELPLSGPGLSLSEALFSSPTTAERLLSQSTPLDQLSANTTYQIKPGDTLSAIAAAHGVSVEELAQANNISNPNRIYVGKTLTIPTANSTVSSIQYQIKAGDTLAGIADAHGVDLAGLAAANGIANPNRIYAGDTITIPQPSVSPPQASQPAEGTPQTGSDPLSSANTSSLLEAVPSAIRRANPEVAAHIERITAMAEKHGLSADQTAYVLATATHESNLGANMEEFASGRDYEGRVDLGNTQPGDGVRFKGRGYVQITGRANYQDWSNRLGIDLVSNPELAERPEIAAEILVIGMKEGTFTGRGLDSYINDSAVDFRNARRIVNGMDKADLIAGYASHYQQALATSPPQATETSTSSEVTVGAEGSNADLWVKHSANIDNLADTITATFDDIVSTWKEHSNITPVITSGNDGRHSSGSLHYHNQAIDLRTNNISDTMSNNIAQDLQAKLGDDYDVLFEHFPSNPSNDHIHIEYDPN